MRLRDRKTAAALAAILLMWGCGGSSTPTAATPGAPVTPTAAPGELAQLDPNGFQTLVLASPRPSLVEFHSPT